MKTQILYLISIIFILHSSFAQIPEASWEKQFAITRSHYFSDVLELTDGSIVLLGALEQPGSRNYDIWLMKCTSNGDTLKTKTLGNQGNDIPMRILSLGDKGFLLALVNLTDEKNYKSRLILVDSDFKELWVKDAGQQSAILRSDAVVDKAGTIWWLNTFQGQTGKPVVSVWKVDSEGNKIMEFNIDEANTLEAYAMQALPDGTLGVSCQIHPSGGKPSVQVIKFGTDGKVIWKSAIPNSGKIMTPQCLCCSPDNSLLMGGWAGLCYNPDAPAEEQIWDYDYLLSKIDASGKVIWTKNYNREGSEMGTALAVLPDGNIMAAGRCETSFSGSIGPWLLFVDKNGKMVKDQVYKFKFVKDKVSRIICTADGGFLVVGPGYIESGQRLTGWIKKLNPVL